MPELAPSYGSWAWGLLTERRRNEWRCHGTERAFNLLNGCETLLLLEPTVTLRRGMRAGFRRAGTYWVVGDRRVGRSLINAAAVPGRSPYRTRSLSGIMGPSRVGTRCQEHFLVGTHALPEQVMSFHSIRQTLAPLRIIVFGTVLLTACAQQ